MGLSEIKKTNIGEQVYRQMRNQILCGEWKPGDKIPSENQLIASFGVSRGTVRQAVQKLSGEGLVITRHGEGTFVQTTGLDNLIQTSVPLFTLGDDEIEKIFEFRAMYESSVAQLAALKATDEQICRMEESCRRMREKADVLEQFVQADLEFHMRVAECTHNTLAVQVYQSYEGLLGPSILNMTRIIGAGNGLKYHALILDAIRMHDPERARLMMQEHMENNMERFRQMTSILKKEENEGLLPQRK